MIPPGTWGPLRTAACAAACALFVLGLALIAAGVALEQHRTGYGWLNVLARAAYAAGGTLLVGSGIGMYLVLEWT